MEGNKKIFIVDASFICSYLLTEGVTWVEKIFEDLKKGKVEFISSTLLDYEVGNVLKTAVMRRRIDKDLAVELWKAYLALKIPLFKPDFSKVFKMSLDFDLTFYDASYLFFVKERNLRLLTLDKKLSSIVEEFIL